MIVSIVAIDGAGDSRGVARWSLGCVNVVDEEPVITGDISAVPTLRGAAAPGVNEGERKLPGKDTSRK